MTEAEAVQVTWSATSGGSPLLRALGERRLLLLQDGLRVSPALTGALGGLPLSGADPFALERVEILRGSSPALGGADAMGGVLNLVTRRPTFDARRAWDASSEARLRYDSAAMGLIGHAGAEGHLRQLGLRLDVGGQRLGDLLGGRAIERQPYSSYWRGQASAAARLMLGAAGTLDLIYQRGDLRDADLPQLVRDRSFARVKQHARDLLALHYAGALPRLFVQGLQASVSLQSRRETRERFRLDLGRIDRERDHALTLSARVQLQTHLPYNRLSYGIDLSHDWISSTGEQELIAEPTRIALGRGRFLDGSTFTQWGLFLNDRLPLGPKLLIDVGGRVAGWRVAVPGDVLNRLDAVKDARWTGLGSLHARYLVGDGLNLVAGLSQGYRPPNLDDHTALGCSASTYQLPNPALRAERNLTAEAGFKFDLFGLVDGSIFYFYSYLYDAILPTSSSLATGSGGSTTTFYCGTGPDGAPLQVPVTQRTNAQHAHIHGIESSLRLRLGKRWTLFAWAAWAQGSATLDLPGGFTEPLSGVPPLHGRAGIRHEAAGQKWFAEATVRWATPQQRLSAADRGNLAICPDGPTDCEGTPAHAVLALRGAIAMHRLLKLTLALENLTNEAYRTHGSVVYAPGFGAIVGLEGRVP